jgi:hypothetical protein
MKLKVRVILPIVFLLITFVLIWTSVQAKKASTLKEEIGRHYLEQVIYLNSHIEYIKMNYKDLISMSASDMQYFSGIFDADSFISSRIPLNDNITNAYRYLRKNFYDLSAAKNKNTTDDNYIKIIEKTNSIINALDKCYAIILSSQDKASYSAEDYKKFYDLIHNDSFNINKEIDSILKSALIE